MARFLGTCDRVRRTETGESFWQHMMNNREEISEAEFIDNVTIAGMLDEGETFSGFTDIADKEGDPCRFFKSLMPLGNVFHIQQAGFEWIFS